MSSAETALVGWEVQRFDVPLHTPFGIATGTQHVAHNVVLRLRLRDGTVGLGEAAPFPAVNGETQADALQALEALGARMLGQDASRYRWLAAEAKEALAATPSARAAFETALLDAFCRHHSLSMWQFWGAAERTLTRDITIPTAGAAEAARAAAAEGFRCLKVKVGASNLDDEAARLEAIHAEAPDCSLILDANAKLNAAQSLELLATMGAARRQLILFEQPAPTADLEGLAEVQAKGRVPVAADESARSPAEVARIARRGDIACANLKLSKSGLFDTCHMAQTAQSHGLALMIGGMVETEITMATSAALAAGLGAFRYIDLDTPLFMGPRPLHSHFPTRGPHITLTATPGHGVALTT